jgi:hypothetical protein
MYSCCDLTSHKRLRTGGTDYHSPNGFRIVIVTMLSQQALTQEGLIEIKTNLIHNP